MDNERVWLFLLPLYFGLASAGLSYFLRFIEHKIPSRSSLVCSALPVILALFLSFSVISSHSIVDSKNTGTLKDAKKITFFLKGFLRREDRVLAICPSDLPLRYYFNLHHVPSKYLILDFNSSNRILLIVGQGQQLEDILSFVTAKNYGAPRLIQRYEFSEIYEMNKVIVTGLNG